MSAVTGTHPGQTPDLFTNPSDTIRNGLHPIDDSRQEGIGNLHQHGQPRNDDRLDIGVRSRRLGRNTTRKRGRYVSGVILDLLNHLLIHLTYQLEVVYEEGLEAYFERVDF